MRDFLPQDKRVYGVALGSIFFVLALFYLTFFSPTKYFPSGSIVSVEEGTSLHALAQKLDEDRVIRSAFWFRAVAITFGGERSMKAGDYHLSEPESVLELVWRIMHGDFGTESIRITIPEGFSAERIAKLFDERFPLFDKESFVLFADEGFLFPDTYFIQASATASSTIKLLNNNFKRQIADLEEEIAGSGRTLLEVITMASILEGEAKTEEDMRTVAGILWKRLDLGMPLQVDTTFVYILGKGTKDLTSSDLKVDSPYNTYLYKGLPPTPISNPGLVSIRSALNPTHSSYLYFLTADDGTMHYAETHEEHVANKQKYLK